MANNNINTADLLHTIHSADIDPVSREVWLIGREEHISSTGETDPGVEFAMANRAIRNLRFLGRSGKRPVLVHMKTCGGHWSQGMAIYNAIEACPAFVTILAYGEARSMSSIILQAADQRIMMRDSIFMFHDGTVEFSGTVRQFRSEYALNETMVQRMMGIYLRRCRSGKGWARRVGTPVTDAKILSWMRAEMDRREEVYLPATEAVELGFADGVFGEGIGWSDLL